MLLALSGGVDSSVAAALLAEAVGEQLTCVFVDHGLMRLHEGDEVEAAFGRWAMHFVRVDAESLDRQLTLAGCEDRRELPFHKMLLNNDLPLTMGGGIGQSRLCMLMIGCCHIGEVQVSLWDQETLDTCGEYGIQLL